MEQTRQAVADLVTTEYPHLERAVHDPPIAGQKYALVSFCLSEANKFNVVAFAKIRGVFDTVDEALAHARTLVRKVDSVNKIHTVRVGAPFPISDSILGQVDKVDVDVDELDEKYAEAEKKLRYYSDCQQVQNKQDIKDRVQALKDDVQEDMTKDPVEQYILKRNKMATSAALYEDYVEKTRQLETIMIKTHAELKELETPEILDSYVQVYEKRLRSIGIDPRPTDKVKSYFEVLPTFDFLNNKC
jgi:hypothetical protein